LLALIDGLDWTKVHPVDVKRPQTVGAESLRRIESGRQKAFKIRSDSAVMQR
jgi:hypothetical protein